METIFGSCVVSSVTVSDEVPGSACAGISGETGVSGEVVATVSGRPESVFPTFVWLCWAVLGTSTGVTGIDCECASFGLAETGGFGTEFGISASVVPVDGSAGLSGTGSTALGAAGMDTGAVDVGALL